MTNLDNCLLAIRDINLDLQILKIDKNSDEVVFDKKSQKSLELAYDDIETVDLQNEKVKLGPMHNQNDGDVLLSISQRGVNSQASNTNSETSKSGGTFN
jgi:hypothetical protein